MEYKGLIIFIVVVAALLIGALWVSWQILKHLKNTSDSENKSLNEIRKEEKNKQI